MPKTNIDNIKPQPSQQNQPSKEDIKGNTRDSCHHENQQLKLVQITTRNHQQNKKPGKTHQLNSLDSKEEIQQLRQKTKKPNHPRRAQSSSNNTRKQNKAHSTKHIQKPPIKPRLKITKPRIDYNIVATPENHMSQPISQ